MKKSVIVDRAIQVLFVLLALVCGISPASAQTMSDRYLVLVYVPGGLDSLVMLQPDQGNNGPNALDLQNQRPTIFRIDNPNVAGQEIIPLMGTGYGVYPSMTEFSTTFGLDQFAALQKVGIPSMPRSQAEAEDIIARGIPTVDNAEQTGWVNRWARKYLTTPLEVIDASGGHKTTVAGYEYKPSALTQQIASSYGFVNLPAPSTTSDNLFRRDTIFAIAQLGNSLGNFELDRMNQHIAQSGELAPRMFSSARRTAPGLACTFTAYQNTVTGRQFDMVDQSIARFNETKVAFIRADEQGSIGAAGGGVRTFNTHKNEITSLNSLLPELNNALNRFRLNMSICPHPRGGTVWDRTTVVIYSDYGRTISENKTAGTDEGDGQTIFLLGGAVNPGIWGTDLSVTEIFSPSNVIPVETNLVDVWADLMTGMGYNPQPIFPGYTPKPLGLLK